MKTITIDLRLDVEGLEEKDIEAFSELIALKLMNEVPEIQFAEPLLTQLAE